MQRASSPILFSKRAASQAFVCLAVLGAACAGTPARALEKEPPASASRSGPANPSQTPASTPTAEIKAEAKTDPKATMPPADKPVGEAQAVVQKYCANIAAAATDARFAWQSKKLLDVENRIKARIAELDGKQAELKSWFDKRDAINKAARDTLVGIYGKMKAETAAAQISALDDDMAVAVLAALPTSKASAIFNEISPADRAAKIASLLANPSALQDKKL